MGDVFGDQCGIDFEDIPNQIYKREMDREYKFNLMLVGLAGIGKSALVTSLFKAAIKPNTTQGQKLNTYEELIEENGVKLRVRCVETSDYDRHKIEDYVKYIDDQLRAYYEEHRKKSSWNRKDDRIHCCLYFIPPPGKMRLRKEDIDCMKALHEKVNLVPIIAKADTISASQAAKFKENIIEDLEKNGVKYFKFQHDEKEDEERSKLVRVEAERFPFAIIAADEPTQLADRKKYRWVRSTAANQIDILDSKICDFDALAKLLIRHCMLDLIDSTHVKHYAKFHDEMEAARK